MPKLGMEPIRRAALVKATIGEIGRAGSLDVTVSQIARRAGMSTALAHHYFGGKDQIFLAAMRHILTALRRRGTGALAPGARTRARGWRPSCAPASAQISFSGDVVSAWLNFYVAAQTSAQARALADDLPEAAARQPAARFAPAVGAPARTRRRTPSRR